MRVRELYSQLRRGFIGRFGDAYIIAMLMDGTGFWPGLLGQVNAHIIMFAVGSFIISIFEDSLHMIMKPKPPPCGSVEPELNFDDDQ